jgi:Ca2+-binding RTX toxin-like protein
MRIFHWLFGRKPSAALQAAAAPVVEAIESRLLLTCNFDPVTGALTVDGTTGADTISVNTSVGVLSVTGAGACPGYTKTSVTSILVRADLGNDSVTIQSTVSSSIPVTINGAAGNDTLTGGNGNDTITGDAGTDSILGGAGNDSITGGDDADTIDGQAGDDAINGGAANDSLLGGSNNDTIDGDTGADVISGGSGTDKADFHTRSANLTIDLDDVADDGAVSENDNVKTDIEQVETGSGSDWIYGNANTGAANATLIGGGGADAIVTGKGDDSIEGGDGNDAFYALSGTDGADTLRGGNGTDTAIYNTRTANLTIDLDGAADDGASGEGDNVDIDVENVECGSGNDLVTGNSNNNNLSGGFGSDTLYGMAGNDGLYEEGGDDSVGNQLFGGDGNDTLYGGGNSDTLYGEGDDDLIYSYGDGYADSVNAGAGNDTVEADSLDFVSNSETTHIH